VFKKLFDYRNKKQYVFLLFICALIASNLEAPKDNILNVFKRFRLDKKTYSSGKYFALKEFFKQIIIAENSYITLKKQK
jgi:hypothetical protein